MRKLIITLISLIIVACASENQQRGLDAIAEHYNTETSFTKGFQTNAGKTITKFTIKVGSSELLDTLPEKLAASNIALMLYESFSAEEREDYTNIEVKMQQDSLAEAESYYFDPGLMRDALDQSAIFSNFSDNLIDKNYDAIAQSMEPQYQSPKLATNLGNYMRRLHSAHGNLIAYKRLGFGIYTKANNEKRFHFSGHLTFSDGYKRPYVLTTSMKVNEDYISGYGLDN